MKPDFTLSGIPAAWGDLSESTQNMLANLFGVSIRLPTALKSQYPTSGSVLSILASAVTLPEETIATVPIETKLSDYDIVVGKKRGDLSITFKEQMGAPVLTLFDAWHRVIVDARGNGIGWGSDFKTEVWIAALTGDDVPYYWWGFRECFPTARGKADFSNETKDKVDVTIPWSYLEQIDQAEALSGAGANFTSLLDAAARQLGV